MKTLISIVIFSALAIGVNHAEHAAIPSTRYVVQIAFTELESEKGNIMVAVYNSKESFLNESKAFRKIVIPANDSDQIKRYMLHLAEGTYAVAVFHDTNSNGKLDRNFFSYPTEPFGFSNGASASFGPPSFESAAFVVQKDMTIEIKLS